MKIVYANTTTSIGGPNGGIHRLVEGEPWSAADPLVKHRPEFFSENPTKVKTSEKGWTPVEQATAAPGEKRATRRAK